MEIVIMECWWLLLMDVVQDMLWYSILCDCHMKCWMMFLMLTVSANHVTTMMFDTHQHETHGWCWLYNGDVWRMLYSQQAARIMEKLVTVTWLSTSASRDYPQDCPPQDCPLGGNPEVGNPKSISHQDCPPQLLCFSWIVCAWYGSWVNAGNTAIIFNHNILKNKVIRAIEGDI